MQPTTYIIALAAALASANGAASCGETGRSVRIVYTDLDLGTPAGVAEFDRRVHDAARKVCTDPRDGETVLVRRACVRGTIAAAKPRVREIARRAAKDRAASETALVVRAQE